MPKCFVPRNGTNGKSNNTHTNSPNRVVNPNEPMTLYSVTLRRGQGIDLGRNSPDSRFVNYLLSISSRYAISVEKAGKEAHFQCLIVSNKNINEIKNQIRYIYFDWTDAQKRHALHIVLHNDITILYEYVCKQFWCQLPNMSHIYNPIWSTFGHRYKDIPPELSYPEYKEYIHPPIDVCKNSCFHRIKCVNALYHNI